MCVHIGRLLNLRRHTMALLVLCVAMSCCKKEEEGDIVSYNALLEKRRLVQDEEQVEGQRVENCM